MAMLGLGHVGIYVHDLETMVAFYRDTLGLRITKQNRRAGIVLLSADPERADHEIALFSGPPKRCRFARDQPNLTPSGEPRRPARCLPKAD